MCAVLGPVLAVALVALIGIASWVTYPIAWSWWRPDPEDVARMRRRAQRIGLQGWFLLGGFAVAFVLLGAWLGC
jgi:nitric oxide reductase large subunit